MKTKVYLQNGTVINVGPWDEQRVFETKVVLNGEVICIGAWDFAERTERQIMKGGECIGLLPIGEDPPDDPEITVSTVVFVDNPLPDGAVIEKFEVICNPLPEDAVEVEADVTMTAKGRVVTADDYRALRGDEYPSIGDQLDALWKGGDAASNMAEAIARIKEKYPKPI